MKKDQILGQMLGNTKPEDLRTRARRARGELWSQRQQCSPSHEVWKVEVGVPLFLKYRATCASGRISPFGCPYGCWIPACWKLLLSHFPGNDPTVKPAAQSQNLRPFKFFLLPTFLEADPPFEQLPKLRNLIIMFLFLTLYPLDLPSHQVIPFCHPPFPWPSTWVVSGSPWLLNWSSLILLDPRSALPKTFSSRHPSTGSPGAPHCPTVCTHPPLSGFLTLGKSFNFCDLNFLVC